MKTDKFSRPTRALAGVVVGALGSAGAIAAESETNRAAARNLEEIVVSAQKRESSLLDTPISISAIGMEDIAERNLVSMEDYLSAMPSVTHNNAVSVLNDITFRGLGGFWGGDATVGVYFGEVPMTSPQYSIFSADMKLVDMARVEVLRGPQGSLYGASSLGGTLRSIPNAPDLRERSANVSVGRSLTARGGDPNTSLTGMINIPLAEDRLALRIAAYDMHNGGYVDNIAPEVPWAIAETQRYGGPIKYDANNGAVDFKGVRSTLRWQPNDQLRATFMYAWQNVYQDGDNRPDDRLGPYQGAFWPVTGGYSKSDRTFFQETLDLANLVIEYDMGWASLMSSTSWYEGGYKSAQAFVPPLNQAKIARVKKGPDERKAVFEELRLVSDFGGAVEFTAGYFYQQSEDGDSYNWVWMGDPALFPADYRFRGIPVSNVNSVLAYTHASAELTQHALYGELYYKFLDHWTLTLGGRYFDYERTSGTGVVPDPVGPIDPAALTFRTAKESDFVRKVNLSYKSSDSATYYLEWGEGFRIGRPGAFPAVPTICDADGDGVLDGTNARIGQNLKSDTTDNLELGAKMRFFDNRISLNTAVYRIDWKNLPTQIFSPVQGCATTVAMNASEATSFGVEAEAQVQLTDGLRLDISGSYNDATLSQDDPGVRARKGDRIPRAAEVNARAALEYETYFGDHRAFVGADYSYISGFWTDIAKSLQEMGDYGTVGVRAGLDFDRIRVQLYGKNLTNEDAYVQVYSYGVVPLRPRVIGIELSFDFL